jgi:hypothetical protein
MPQRMLRCSLLNMTMSRGKILILGGSSALVLGALLLGWEPSAAGDVVGLLLLFSGILILFAGCIAFCAKQDAKQVLLAGAITSGVSLIVVPLLTSLLHFQVNVHDWTGLLFFFIWIPACVIGSVFLLVGVIRFLLQRGHGH